LDPKKNQFFPWIKMVRIWHGTAFLFSPEYNAKPAKHVKRKTAASPSHAGPLRGGKTSRIPAAVGHGGKTELRHETALHRRKTAGFGRS
jgi:hypothetical protein